jgi:plastocyanin
MKSAGLLVLGIAAILVAACSQPQPAPSGAASLGNAVPTSEAIMAGEDRAVSIKDFKFEPATLTVEVGQAVTWTNADSTAHTTTGDKKEWDSGSLGNAKSFTHTFTAPEKYTYACAIHPNMKGTILVQ